MIIDKVRFLLFEKVENSFLLESRIFFTLKYKVIFANFLLRTLDLGLICWNKDMIGDGIYVSRGLPLN